MKYKITDDSGFLALVDSNIYTSFVKEDWELDSLFSHFVSEMNKGCFLIWQTSNFGGGLWNCEFLMKKSNKKSTREFSSKINVTEGKIYLNNFEDLTIAASYPDQKIPVNHNSDLYYELENGLYNITVRQLFDPDDYEDEVDVNFEFVIEKDDSEFIQNEFDKIKWRE